MSILSLNDVMSRVQLRNSDQETIFTRHLSPLMRNTYLFDNYSYGWSPETAVWCSRFADLDLRDYYPISLGLIKKFEFMLSLYKGPKTVYEEKIQTEFINQGSFSGRYINYFRKFSTLPTNEYISFLLLTSIPIYNILFWFKDTQFDITKHTLFRNVYTNHERHIALARYLRDSGDYKPIFSRLDQDGTYTDQTTLVGRILVGNTNPNGYNTSDFETLSNLSAILYYTKYDPVLMFLVFYLPGISVTTKITPAVEYLMSMLNITQNEIILI
ncbi:hypothetical protein [Cetacean poxvirus 1]|nr:hypothetical protein [Cetacean poxvirus 1]